MTQGNGTGPWSSMDPTVSPDHAFDRLLPKLVECFGVMLAGVLAGRLKLFNKSETGGLNFFTANFALPSLIFLNLARLDSSTDVHWPFLSGILLGKALVFLLVVVVALTANRSGDLAQAAIYAIFVTHVNDFGLAYPILQAVYSETHPSYPNYIYLIGLISLALLNPIGFLMIEVQRAKDEPKLQVHSASRRRTAYRMTASILKRIATNPNVFMTVFGVLANITFNGHMPPVLISILKDFGDTFQGTVLFLLGLQVACTQVNKDTNCVAPALLLVVKMLISPLITMGSVKLLCLGSQDSSGLSDYGFLYGTVPTAPVVLVYAAQFAMPTETLAMALVLCTFLSGPLMYVSARMLAVQQYSLLPYMKLLRETILCLSSLGLVSCFWVLLLLILGRKWRRPPYLALMLLLVAQTVMSVGLLIWSSASGSTWVSYLDISAVTGGHLACRFCTVILAIVLFLTPKYSSQEMHRYLPLLVFFGFGVPGVAILCLLVTARPMLTLLPNMDTLPSFLFGDTEACMAVIVLSFCLITTLGCLLLFYRQRAREETPTPSFAGTASDDASPVLSDSSDLSTIQEESPSQEAEDAEKELQGRERPLPPNTLTMEYEDAWSNRMDKSNARATKKRKKSCKSKSSIAVTPYIPGPMGKQIVAWGPALSSLDDQKCSVHDQETQAGRHVALLLYLCISMIMGLTTSIWKLLAEERTGIYVALEFLDIILNFGQPIVCALIFGHDLEPVISPIRKCFHRLKNSPQTILTQAAVPRESESQETNSAGDQFATMKFTEVQVPKVKKFVK